MLIRYDNNVIRSIEFKKSEEEIIKVGDFVNPPDNKPLWHHVTRFPVGEDIIGVFGRTENTNPLDGSAPATHFVSLGFFMNRCENPRLKKISHEVGPPVVIQQHVIASEKVYEQPVGLIVAVIALSLTLFLVTILCLLRRCGWICQPK